VIEPTLIAVERTPAAFADAIRTQARCGARRLGLQPDDPFASEILKLLPELERVDPADADVVCRTDDDPVALAGALNGELDRRGGAVIVPQLPGHGLDRHIFLISIPKAGTHLLYRLAETLGFKPGVVCPDRPSPGHWYCVEYSNSHTVPRDFFVDSVRRAPFGNRDHPFMRTPALFMVRHPLDILVSEANYNGTPGNTAFAGFYAGLDLPGRVERLLKDDRLLGRFADRLLAFAPWLCFQNVIPMAFEDLVGPPGGGDGPAQERLIWSIQLKLGVPGRPREIARRLFDCESPTFREGRIGSHRTQLHPALTERAATQAGEALRAFGYRPGDDLRSQLAESWRRRPLRIDAPDFDDTPILVQSGYLGHGLVRYLGRYYGVPAELGAIDLAAERHRLSGFPQAESLEALRSKIGMGPRHVGLGELAARVHSLESTMDERTQRLAAVEATLDERSRRLTAVEATLDERSHRLTVVEAELKQSRQRLSVIDGARPADPWRAVLDVIGARIEALARNFRLLK